MKLNNELYQHLQLGTVIPAHPLALNADRNIDEKMQRQLTRYYIESGAGGMAVAVHSTQFEIRDPEVNLFTTVLSWAVEEVAKAKSFLEEVKSKYYDEIKLKPSINKDQQKALDFFNRYKEDQEANEKKYQRFQNDTKSMFSNEFKGFEFNLGEKSFRYAVNNAETIAERQSDINNLVKKFLNKDGEVQDVKGYHKAIYAAENVDSIAKHFYEQGKADAVKDIVAKSNNITTEPRQNASELNLGGFRVKAVNGVDSSKLKIQKRF